MIYSFQSCKQKFCLPEAGHEKRKNVLFGVSQDGISNCEVLDMSMEPGPSVELNVPSLLKK